MNKWLFVVKVCKLPPNSIEKKIKKIRTRRNSSTSFSFNFHLKNKSFHVAQQCQFIDFHPPTPFSFISQEVFLFSRFQFDFPFRRGRFLTWKTHEHTKIFSRNFSEIFPLSFILLFQRNRERGKENLNRKLVYLRSKVRYNDTQSDQEAAEWWKAKVEAEGRFSLKMNFDCLFSWEDFFMMFFRDFRWRKYLKIHCMMMDQLSWSIYLNKIK